MNNKCLHDCVKTENGRTLSNTADIKFNYGFLSCVIKLAPERIEDLVGGDYIKQ